MFGLIRRGLPRGSRAIIRNGDAPEQEHKQQPAQHWIHEAEIGDEVDEAGAVHLVCSWRRKAEAGPEPHASSLIVVRSLPARASLPPGRQPSYRRAGRELAHGVRQPTGRHT